MLRLVLSELVEDISVRNPSTPFHFAQGKMLGTMNMKEEIYSKLLEIARELGVSDVSFDLTPPTNLSFGDYSSNIALVLFPRVKGEAERGKFKTPQELAEEISSRFPLDAFPFIEKIEILKPGFINFWLKREEISSQVYNVLKNRDQVVIANQLKNKKIMVEFTDPNPFKEFHIGHLYSNTVGESLSRMFEALGAEVKRADYFGDVGMHVAKALYGFKKLLSEQNLDVKALLGKSLEERVKFLGEGYALGAKEYESDEKAKEEMKVINYLVFISAQEYMKKTLNWQPVVDYRQYLKERELGSLSEISKLYEAGRAWSLDYFETIYKRLGTKFDYYFPESIVGEYGAKIVQDHIQDGIFEKHDGAIIFKGEAKGLHTRVFINSMGLPTYEAKELGLNSHKYEKYQFDTSVIVTGNEINEYFKVLLAAMNMIIPEVAAKTKHIGHGMVRLPEGKMSSRTGNVIAGEWVLDETKRRISEQYTNMDIETLEAVGVGAVKYALLKSGIGKNVEFNFNESISFEGNSGPYLQYTFARTQSVLGKADSGQVLRQAQGIARMTSFWGVERLQNLNPEEEVLLRLLYRFPEVVEVAAQQYSPNVVCTYLFELSQKFNLFYQKHKILESEQKELRLFLTEATGAVLKRGLHLLGIKAPERM